MSFPPGKDVTACFIRTCLIRNCLIRTGLTRNVPLPGPATKSSLCAFAPVRMTGLATAVRVQLKHARLPRRVTTFTLHTVSGSRLSGGGLQLDEIAGFCHLLGCLKTYSAHQIISMQDPESNADISDLQQWLETRDPCHDGAALQAALRANEQKIAASVFFVHARRHIRVTAAINKAIACASNQGFHNIVDQLTGIRDAVSESALSFSGH